MDNLINSFSKYTGITTKNVEEIMEDIQKQTLSELDDEIHNSNLIKWEHDSDGDRMNTDNLIEWLNLYYTVEKK
jgi:hypothetical protein